MKKIIIILLLSSLVFISCEPEPSTVYPNEGSIASPVLLTVGSTHSATIDEFGSNYYTFTTASMADHTISLIGVDSDLSWDLFDSADFFTTLRTWCDDYSTKADESMTISSLPVGTYYLMVDEWDSVGGTFDISITTP